MSGENRDQGGPLAAGGCFAGGFQSTVSVGCGRTEVFLQAEAVGDDWLLRITGGKAHVGAVATAHGSDVQLSVVGPHKEGPLAEVCAVQWSFLTGRTCVAVAGIHQDEATREEIDGIVDHVRQGLDILSDRWKEAQSVG